jgi:hypothetical protein
MLYDRDYRILTNEEKCSWEKLENALYKIKAKKGGLISPETLNKYHQNIPVAAYYYQQLFPNHYLDTDELKNKDRLITIMEGFKKILESEATERDILNFINRKKAYFIIASILKGFHYCFGHHKAFAFKEFELPTNHVVDYLLIGKNSGGYEFIFVELENPFGQVTTSDGEFGVTIRKGLKQVNDWDCWLENNYHSLKQLYDKYLGKHITDLPREFYELDKSRLHYAVVAGRRKDFSKKTYQLKRRLLKTNNILLLHYDNLIDSTDLLLKGGNY